MNIPLSQRIRPDVEAAPWVIEEVKKLEAELAARSREVPVAVKASVDSLGGMRQLGESILNGDDHPTLHELFDYITESGPAIDCNCQRCADWKARFAAGAGATAQATQLPVATEAMIEAGYDVLKRIHAGPFDGSPSLGHALDVWNAMVAVDLHPQKLSHEEVGNPMLSGDPETSGSLQVSGDDAAAAASSSIPPVDAPVEAPATHNAETSNGLTAALSENLRNSGPKWTFGSPAAKKD